MLTKIKRTRQQKPFYCICDQSTRRYLTLTSLRNHIKQKHDNLPSYQAHIKHLQQPYNKQKIQLSSNQPEIGLKDIAVNTNDIKKFKIVDKTVLKINQIFKNEGLFDMAKEDQFQNYQEDIDGEFNQRDIKIIDQVQQLIQTYHLQNLFKQLHSFPELQFSRDQQFSNGKVISMKKQLSQYYSLSWASKINLQLDLFALQRYMGQAHQEIEQIKNCQQQMWGQHYKIIPILREYYEQILNSNWGK